MQYPGRANAGRGFLISMGNVAGGLEALET